MSDEGIKYDYSFDVLLEKVSEEDLFEDKTHERVATTLNRLMTSTESGLTIGLEGSWGSGKSTVINILRQKLLTNDKKVFFFAFDAWAHDGDPLRKIFLESLITSIDPNGEDEKLNNLKNEVSARKKTVNVKTEKSASKLGKILSISAVFIPIGAALLTAVPYEDLLWPWNDSATTVNLILLFALLFSSLPIIVLFFWSVFGEKNSLTNKVKWDFFASKSTENYIQDITEDGERTSIEFERFFNETLDYLFDIESGYKYEQAVIVIDNLDRVDPEYAQNIWSTLQTFFQHRSSSLNSSAHEWKNKLWFLIPFDREAIQKIWQSERGEGNKNNVIATSFMEKSFQITVEVPPSVMSAWIDYFKKCVDKSLYGWPEYFKLDYIESYVQCMSRLDKSPSPRRIHNTINRVGVLALHWQGEFSAESLCIYSLARQSLTETEFRSALIAEGVPESFPTTQEVKIVKAELAGILFGVDASKGIQLLLAPEIKASLSKGDGELLRTLESTHKDAFWLVLRASSDDWMVKEIHDDKYNIDAITALHDAFVENYDQLSQYIDRIEYAILNSFQELDLDTYSFSKVMTYLFEMSNDKKSLLESFKQQLQLRLDAFIKKEEFGGNELKHLEELKLLLESEGVSLKTLHYFNLDYEMWSKWLQECESQKVKMKSVLPKKSIYKEIIGNCEFGNNALNMDSVDILNKTYTISSNHSHWDSLIQSIINWLNLPNRDADAEPIYKLIISLLPRISEKEELLLRECITGQEFWQRTVLSEIVNNLSLPFLVAILDTDFRDKEHIPSFIKEYLSEELNEEMIAFSFELFEKTNKLDVIWELARDKDNIFAIQILEKIDNGALFSCDARYVDEINWSSKLILENIVIKLCDNGAIKNLEDGIKEDPQVYSKVIYLINKYGSDSAKEMVMSILNSFDRKEWLKAFENDNELLLCVPNDSSTFSMEWSDYFKRVVIGEIEEPEYNVFETNFNLKDKVLDLIDIHLRDITKKYFEFHEKDYLSEESFMLIAPLMKPYMKDIQQSDYEMKVNSWIDSVYTKKLEWFLNVDVSTQNEPLQMLVANINNKMQLEENETSKVYRALNKKLDLGIKVRRSKNSKTTESDLKVVNDE